MLIFSQLFSQLDFTMKEGCIYIVLKLHTTITICYIIFKLFHFFSQIYRMVVTHFVSKRYSKQGLNPKTTRIQLHHHHQTDLHRPLYTNIDIIKLYRLPVTDVGYFVNRVNNINYDMTVLA